MISRIKSKINLLLSNPDISQAISSWGGRVLITSVLATGFLLGIRQLGALESFELGAFDQLMRWRFDESKDERLLIVGITEEDIQQLDSFPVSDGVIAEVLDKLQQHQPRVIGLDILRDVPVGEGRPALATALEEPNIISVCAMSGTNNNMGAPPPPELAPEQVTFADFPSDRDSIQRRTSLVSYPPEWENPHPIQHLCNNPEEQLISLAYYMSLLYLEAEGIGENVTEADEMKVGSVILKPLEPNAGGYQNADAGDYQILINYRSRTEPSEQVSLMDVLEEKVEPELIRDRIVIIGYTAPSTQDVLLTPYSAGLEAGQLMPGVIVHGQVVSQIISSVLDGRSLIWYWPQGGEFLWIWGWSLIGGILTWRKIKQVWLVIIAEGVAFILLVGICYGTLVLAGWIPLIPSAMALILTAFGVILTDRVPAIKKLFKIEVEVDWDKVRQEADKLLPGGLNHEDINFEKSSRDQFLAELQQKAKERRNRRKDNVIQDAIIPQDTPPRENFGDQLWQKAIALKERLSKKLRLKASQSSTNVIQNQANQSEQELELLDGRKYLDNLLRKARRLRNIEVDDNSFKEQGRIEQLLQRSNRLTKR